jgi:hypothetical protein
MCYNSIKLEQWSIGMLDYWDKNNPTNCKNRFCKPLRQHTMSLSP